MLKLTLSFDSDKELIEALKKAYLSRSEFFIEEGLNKKVEVKYMEVFELSNNHDCVYIELKVL